MSSKRPPTREQLLDVKHQQEAVQYGKGLLEKKRDVLMRKLENDRIRFRELEIQFTRLCADMSTYYSLVRMYEGQGILQIMKPGRAYTRVTEKVTSIMGCSYSQFKPVQGSDGNLDTPSYDPAMTSLYVDDLLVSLENMRTLLWEYINLRTRIVALESELRKSLLKINSLEHVILPDLQEEQKFITEVLSERARQEQFAVKKIKKKKIKNRSESQQGKIL